MKSLLSVFGLLFCFSQAGAQITITDSDMPSAGDTLRYSEASTLFSIYNFDTTGDSITWNYSDLEATANKVQRYESTTGFVYAFAFPFGYGTIIEDSLNLAVINLEDIYEFYDNSASVFEVVGGGITITGIDLPGTHNDADEKYQFQSLMGSAPSTKTQYDVVRQLNHVVKA